MQIFLNTIDAYKKLHTYRNSLISTEDPGITPGTTEALKYLVFSQVRNTQPHQTIKKDEELLRLKATIRKRKRRIPLRYSAMKQSKGEGWREIGNQQVWFENAWHANYARFLDRYRNKDQN